MHKLKDLGFENRCDTFDTYWTYINWFELHVSKHISSKKWECVLIEWNDERTESVEIYVSYDCTFQFVNKLCSLLRGNEYDPYFKKAESSHQKNINKLKNRLHKIELRFIESGEIKKQKIKKLDLFINHLIKSGKITKNEVSEFMKNKKS